MKFQENKSGLLLPVEPPPPLNQRIVQYNRTPDEEKKRLADLKRAVDKLPVVRDYHEPWEIGEQTTDAPCSNATVLATGSGEPMPVAHTKGYWRGPDAAQIANRICECVNFCRRMPEGLPESSLVQFCKDYLLERGYDVNDGR